MRKFFLLLLVTSSLLACNSNTGKPVKEGPKTQADSLEQDIDDGHIVGMSKMGKLNRTQQQVSAQLDSIAKLPAKARKAAEPYARRLDTLLKELDYADFAMNKWMNEYEVDSAIDNAKERINYLLSEKNKVDKLKEAILTSLQKADSFFLRKQP